MLHVEFADISVLFFGNENKLVCERRKGLKNKHETSWYRSLEYRIRQLKQVVVPLVALVLAPVWHLILLSLDIKNWL